MPLWDNLRRQVEAIPDVAAYDGAADFAPMFDASLGVVSKVLLKDLRSKELISVPMFTSRTAAPTVTTSTIPLRVLRAPYAMTIERIYATCDTAGAGNTSFDVMKNSASLWGGGASPTSQVTLGSSVRVNSEVPTTTTFAEMDEFRFYVAAVNSSIRIPWLHVFGYRT